MFSENICLAFVKLGKIVCI